jgi:hypothetical protein
MLCLRHGGEQLPLPNQAYGHDLHKRASCSLDSFRILDNTTAVQYAFSRISSIHLLRNRRGATLVGRISCLQKQLNG